MGSQTGVYCAKVETSQNGLSGPTRIINTDLRKSFGKCYVLLATEDMIGRNLGVELGIRE